MHRTNIYLSDGQLQDLRRLGAEDGRSVAELVREAVDGLLGRASPPDPPGSDGTTHPQLRRAASGFPRSPEEWDMRPYLLQDYDISWRDFAAMLRSGDARARRWAFTRLLEGGAWTDIWRLVTVGQVAAELPELRLRDKRSWKDFVAAGQTTR